MRGDLDAHPELDPTYMWGWKVLGVFAAVIAGGATLLGFR